LEVNHVNYRSFDHLGAFDGSDYVFFHIILFL
jgi:hypothetical protein